MSAQHKRLTPEDPRPTQSCEWTLDETLTAATLSLFHQMPSSAAEASFRLQYTQEKRRGSIGV